MFKKGFGVFIAIFVLFSGIMLAQDTTDSRTFDRQYDTNTMQDDAVNPDVQRWTDDLKMRLSLTEDQSTQVNEILTRYHNEVGNLSQTPGLDQPPTNMENSRSELQKQYNTEIESVLTENQKTQFRAYSDTWWGTINNPGVQQEEFQNEQQQNESDVEQESDVERDNTDTESNDPDTELE